MTALSVADRCRLVKVLSMLASPHDGERAAAGLLAARIIKIAGTDWDELLKPQQLPAGGKFRSHEYAPMPMTDMGLCVRQLRRLSAWEQDFVLNLRGRSGLTTGQLRKLAEIAADLRKAGAE